MVVEEFGKRLAVNKKAAQKFDVERKQYCINISNRFAALEKLNDSEGINRAWENIKEDIKTSAKENLVLHELKQHKIWFHEKCLVF